MKYKHDDNTSQNTQIIQNDVMLFRYQYAVIDHDASRLWVREQVLERPEQMRDHRTDVAQHADEHDYHHDHRNVTVDGPVHAETPCRRRYAVTAMLS